MKSKYAEAILKKGFCTVKDLRIEKVKENDLWHRMKRERSNE